MEKEDVLVSDMILNGIDLTIKNILDTINK
jgi:hypothetical protein